MLLKGTQLDVVWCFSLRNVLLSLLHLHVLLVTECAHVMDDVEGSLSSTMRTDHRLLNSSLVRRDIHSMVASGTSEMSFLHLWNDLAGSNDDTLDLNQLIDVIRTEISLELSLSQVHRSDLDDVGRVWIVDDLLVEMIDNHIEIRNHGRWVTHELVVESSVKLVQVLTIDIQSEVFGL